MHGDALLYVILQVVMHGDALLYVILQVVYLLFVFCYALLSVTTRCYVLGGYALAPGASRTSHVPNHWSGRVWGRTHCHNGRCETGDCARGLHCNGAGGIPPATLAEITFDAGNYRLATALHPLS